MCQIGSGRGVWDREVSGSDEGEEHHEAEEQQHEDHVHPQRSNHEEEAYDGHCDVVERLARIVSRAVRTAQFGEGGHGVGPDVLLVGQGTPMRSENDEDGKGERVAQDELGHTGERHGNAAQEIVVARQADKGVRRDGAGKLNQGHHRARIRHHEADEAEEGRVCCDAFAPSVAINHRFWTNSETKRTEPFGIIAMTWWFRLEEHALVLLWAERDGDLATQRRAVPVAGGSGMIDLLHCCCGRLVLSGGRERRRKG